MHLHLSWNTDLLLILFSLTNMSMIGLLNCINCWRILFLNLNDLKSGEDHTPHGKGIVEKAMFF